MYITEICKDKRQYLNLLLLADEQESMINHYLDSGTMYLLDDDGITGVCVVTDEKNGILEIKNLAITPDRQNKGYGRKFVQFVADHYSEHFHTLQVGTGDSPLTIPFYEKCGFRKSHVVKNFFIDYYDHPIFEGGVQLIDMIYLRRELKKQDI